MLMKNNTEKLKKYLSNKINIAIEKESREWPPLCIGFTAQPIRPETESKEKENS